MQKFILVTLFRNISTVTAVNETYSYYVESKGGGAENCPSFQALLVSKANVGKVSFCTLTLVSQYIFDTIMVQPVQSIRVSVSSR